MAERAHQVQVHTGQQQQPARYEGGLRLGSQKGGFESGSSGGPSASKILAVITLLPLGGTLLGFSGVTLAATLFGLTLATPVFLICSPVLVPASLAVAFAVFSIFTAGAFALTGLSSLSWALQGFRQATVSMHPLDDAKRRMQEMAVQMGQKTKDVGQTIETKAKEAGK
ncbi:oleosin H1-like [Impatiens glandulifera]|uniref:oleosin H1-like n=1 Tax=Impatiens glandulifera TaxID=253017 RepID=UPI001FB16973|nr:oleosin H1-like [Impatiens glandulifera]